MTFGGADFGRTQKAQIGFVASACALMALIASLFDAVLPGPVRIGNRTGCRCGKAAAMDNRAAVTGGLPWGSRVTAPCPSLMGETLHRAEHLRGGAVGRYHRSIRCHSAGFAPEVQRLHPPVISIDPIQGPGGHAKDQYPEEPFGAWLCTKAALLRACDCDLPRLGSAWHRDKTPILHRITESPQMRDPQGRRTG